MSDDKVVVSDVPLRYLLPSKWPNSSFENNTGKMDQRTRPLIEMLSRVKKVAKYTHYLSMSYRVCDSGFHAHHNIVTGKNGTVMRDEVVQAPPRSTHSKLFHQREGK